LARIAGELRKMRPSLSVYLAHLEVTGPSIADALATCARDGVSELFVHPFFLTPGRHAARDVPRELEAAAAAHPGLKVRVTAPLGASAGIAELILATLPAE
jgi:sirohydrochlorin ferrochelatase